MMSKIMYANIAFRSSCMSQIDCPVSFGSCLNALTGAVVEGAGDVVQGTGTEQRFVGALCFFYFCWHVI